MFVYNSNKYYKLVIVARYVSTDSIIRVVSLASSHPSPVFSVVRIFISCRMVPQNTCSLTAARRAGGRGPLSAPDENSPVAFSLLTRVD